MTNIVKDFIEKDVDFYLLKKYIDFCIFYNNCGNSTLSLVYKNLPELSIQKQKELLNDFKKNIIDLMKSLETCNLAVSKLNIKDNSIFYNNFKNLYLQTFKNLIFVLNIIENYNI